MEKIAINPARLQFCCNMLGIDITELHKDIGVAQNTLKQVVGGEEALSIAQLEKIANFFNRSLLFFLNPKDAQEDKIYSPQFRTINNQKPLRSRKINALIERVEQHRKVYLTLLADLNTSINEDWCSKSFTGDIKQVTNIVRQWLGVQDNLDFDQLRALVESKGIMVFVSNGYSGKWQIDKNSPVRGFALYYQTLPVIVIKKQTSKGAQAFTLMHELAHLLLHKESMLDENEDFYTYEGKEKEANEFASSVLMPDSAINTIDLEVLQNLYIQEHDNYLKPFKQRWCVSGDAILYRLFRDNKITMVHYQTYKNLKNKQYHEQEKEKKRLEELGQNKIVPRNYRHREPINIFGKPYVTTVLEAKQNKYITLSKASTYLDGLKIHTLHKLEGEFV